MNFHQERGCTAPRNYIDHNVQEIFLCLRMVELLEDPKRTEPLIPFPSILGEDYLPLHR